MTTANTTKASVLDPRETFDEISRLLAQASAITSLIGDGAEAGASPHQIQNACWAVTDMIEAAKSLACPLDR
jgi:hypothetical protein